MFKSKIIDSTLFVGLSGELDDSCALFIRNKLDALLDDNSIKKVVIEMSELDFMDSTGIGVLLGRYKKMSAKGIPIFVANPSKCVDKILTLSGIYGIMPKIISEA
jgi:stage II sporulation protein AA (anti-sigma F factor antagonist)